MFLQVGIVSEAYLQLVLLPHLLKLHSAPSLNLIFSCMPHWFLFNLVAIHHLLQVLILQSQFCGQHWFSLVCCLILLLVYIVPLFIPNNFAIWQFNFSSTKQLGLFRVHSLESFLSSQASSIVVIFDWAYWLSPKLLRIRLFVNDTVSSSIRWLFCWIPNGTSIPISLHIISTRYDRIWLSLWLGPLALSNEWKLLIKSWSWFWRLTIIVVITGSHILLNFIFIGI